MREKGGELALSAFLLHLLTWCVYLLLDEDGDEAPLLELDGPLALELDGELALGLDELAPLEEPALDEPVDAESDDPPTPRAASVCRSSLPELWIPLDCWNSFTAAWVFGPSLPSAGPESMPAALSFS
jgi:hypothetical protein